MAAIAISKRGTITLPPRMRQQLGLDAVEHPMVLAEIRDGGIFLQPAATIPVRDIPLKQMRQWIKEDESNAGVLWEKAKKTKPGKKI